METSQSCYTESDLDLMCLAKSSFKGQKLLRPVIFKAIKRLHRVETSFDVYHRGRWVLTGRWWCPIEYQQWVHIQASTPIKTNEKEHFFSRTYRLKKGVSFSECWYEITCSIIEEIVYKRMA